MVGHVEVELVLTDSQHSDIFDLLIRDLVESAEEPQSEENRIDPIPFQVIRLATAS